MRLTIERNKVIYKYGVMLTITPWSVYLRLSVFLFTANLVIWMDPKRRR